MRRKTLVIVCLLVIGLMVASAVPIGAKKPPSPPDDGGGDATGTIYYLMKDNAGDITFWNMDADGGNKAEFTDSWPGSLSLNQHDGSYWFVYFEELTTTHYGDIYQTELWAVRADGTGDPIDLWDDPSMVYIDGWNGDICWMTDDAYISWVTWKLDENGDIYDPGIYTASMSWGDDDDTPELGTPEKVHDLGTYDYDTGDVRAAGCSPIWSPDGALLLYWSYDTGRMLVDFSDPDDPDYPKETSFGYNGEAAFSPDGTRIAVTVDSESLVVMDIDGSNEKTIASVKSTKYLWRNLQFIHWSPDSAYITYGSLTINWPDMDCDVYIIGADGSGRTALTRTTTTCDWYVPLEWR